MIHLKLSSVNAHPAEIFKALEDRRSEIDWALNFRPTPIPKVTIPKIQGRAGIINFIKQLKP